VVLLKSLRREREPLGPRFRRLRACFTLASSGDGFAYGAVPLLAVVLDPHPLAVSAVVAADDLPWMLAALPAGAFADRFERSRVILVVNLVRACVLCCAGVLIVTHEIDIAFLIGAVFLNSAARAVYYSSLQATVAELVPSQYLERANGVLSGTEAAAEHVAGPMLGAAAFAAVRMLPFFADAAALASSGLPLLRLRTKSRERSGSGDSILEGLRVLLRDRRLRVLVLLLGMLSGLQGLVSGVLVLVATRDWGVHTSTYGVFLAAGAIGVVPGAMAAEAMVQRFGSAPVLLAASVSWAAAYFVMGWAHSWLEAGPPFVFTGFAIGLTSVVGSSMRQRLTPDAVMGRVGSAWRGIVWGAAPVGALAAGSLALLGGLRLPLLLAGALQCVLTAMLAGPLVKALPKDLDGHLGAEPPPVPSPGSSG
jgi:MFS family permease